MPWKIKKIGSKYCVAKSSTGKCTGSKRYSSKKAATPYLRALYANESTVNEDFNTVTESVSDYIDNSQPGFWYELVNPTFEYRRSSRQKVIALPPKTLSGNLLENRGDKFIRLENEMDSSIASKYGLRRAMSLNENFPAPRNRIWSSQGGNVFSTEMSLLSHGGQSSKMIDPWNRTFEINGAHTRPQPHFDAEGEITKWTSSTTVNGNPVELVIYND